MGYFLVKTLITALIVAAILGYLALSGAWQIIRAARKDLHTHRVDANA